MSVYTFTFITVVSMYLAYLWGRYLTRGEIAAEVANNTLNRLEREGFIKYVINKKGVDNEQFICDINSCDIFIFINIM